MTKDEYLKVIVALGIKEEELDKAPSYWKTREIPNRFTCKVCQKCKSVDLFVKYRREDYWESVSTHA